MVVSLRVNGTVHSVTADLDTPLLYVLRNDLGLNAAKFGCGLGQCGACTVLIDGAASRSCVMPIGALTQSEIITLEGLGTLEQPHPLQDHPRDSQSDAGDGAKLTRMNRGGLASRARVRQAHSWRFASVADLRHSRGTVS